MRRSISPWGRVFAGLDKVDFIKNKCLLQHPPLLWNRMQQGEDLSREVHRGLSATYVPTEGAVEIISKIVRITAAFAGERYPSESQYLARVNAMHLEVEPGPIICLTGLAGVGKSSLIAALGRLLAQQDDIRIPGHGARAHRPMLSIRMSDKWGEREIARQLGFRGQSSIDLARALYLQGTSLITQDEHQFMAAGVDSHARQAKLIYSVAKQGPITLVGMNYSLVHKFKKRPQEERDRILREPIILFPEALDSAGWNDLMLAWDAVLQEILNFKLSQNSSDFWILCVGIKRTGIRLLELAAIRSMARGEKISWEDVKSAHASATFSEMRSDIDVLSSLRTDKRTARRDMICPFENEAEALYQRSVKEALRKTFFRAAVVDALPKKLREATTEELKAPAPKPAARKPRLKRDVESLISASIVFQQG